MKRATSPSGLPRPAATVVDPEKAGEAGVQRMHQLTSSMLDIVDTLNGQISGVLAKQEKEFLRAYRAHMYTVQRELQTLRAKADEAALQMQRDEKLKALEAERDWYRNESIRLDRFSTSLKGELGYLKDKLYTVEQDRVWLDKEVKHARRKVQQLEQTNAMLRGETVLPLPAEEQEEGVEGADGQQAGGSGRGDNAQTQRTSPTRSISRGAARSSSKGPGLSESKHGADGGHSEELLASLNSRDLLNLLSGGKLASGAPGTDKTKTTPQRATQSRGGARR